MRVIGYPALQREQLNLSCGEHTDYGCWTILAQDETPDALEVQLPTGQWEKVQPRPGAFVVNLGDMLSALVFQDDLSSLAFSAQDVLNSVITLQKLTSNVHWAYDVEPGSIPLKHSFQALPAAASCRCLDQGTLCGHTAPGAANSRRLQDRCTAVWQDLPLGMW